MNLYAKRKINCCVAIFKLINENNIYRWVNIETQTKTLDKYHSIKDAIFDLYDVKDNFEFAISQSEEKALDYFHIIEK